MHDRPVITLTTDFGCNDPFVGVMKGVILKINPAAEIVDITHGVHPQDIREAAFTVGMNYRFFPDDSIHVVVVDPGVGSERRPIVVLADHHYFVGPDNGVFSHVYNSARDSFEVIHITADHYFLSSHSPTFQGRDVFAPVAAYLSRGVAMARFGERIADYRKMQLPFPVITAEGALRGEIIHIDRFGNAMTNIAKAEIERLSESPDDGVKILFSGKEVMMRKFYSESGPNELSCLVNSSGYLELFVFKGSAASEYGISVGDEVVILPG
jgi:S-adenosyl-L-methionine hydrolase (adenosine-forming)